MRTLHLHTQMQRQPLTYSGSTWQGPLDTTFVSMESHHTTACSLGLHQGKYYYMEPVHKTGTRQREL